MIVRIIKYAAHSLAQAMVGTIMLVAVSETVFWAQMYWARRDG